MAMKKMRLLRALALLLCLTLLGSMALAEPTEPVLEAVEDVVVVEEAEFSLTSAEEPASAEAPAASDASVGDAVLNLAELLGSASPSGEGSALQAKLVVDLPNGGSLEIPVNIQLSFGTPTIIDSP